MLVAAGNNGLLNFRKKSQLNLTKKCVRRKMTRIKRTQRKFSLKLYFIEVRRNFSNCVKRKKFNSTKTNMSERENNVYKAKLAEQAERYDGKLKL